MKELVTRLQLCALLLATACGDAGVATPPPDAGTPGEDASVEQTTGGFVPPDDAGPEPVDLSEPPFEGAGLPDDLPWGPSLLALQDDVDDEGADDDLAFGIFWHSDAVVVDYVDEFCMGFRTELGTEVGRDLGELLVRGGSGAASQPLTRSDDGYYYLSAAVDPWSEGDGLSVDVDGVSSGPVIVPGAFGNTNVAGLREARRGEDLPLQFISANASHVSVSVSAQTDNQRYLLGCIAPIGQMIWSLPGAALASIPAPVEQIEIKVQAANIDQRIGFALMALGHSSSKLLPLTR